MYRNGHKSLAAEQQHKLLQHVPIVYSNQQFKLLQHVLIMYSSPGQLRFSHRISRATKSVTTARNEEIPEQNFTVDLILFDAIRELSRPNPPASSSWRKRKKLESLGLAIRGPPTN